MNARTLEERQEMTEENIGGALLAAMVGVIKTIGVPWDSLDEHQQEFKIEYMRNEIRKQVDKAVALIAAKEFPHLAAGVESVTFKDGIKAVLKIGAAAEGRHELADLEGGVVMVVMASPQEFLGGMSEVQAEAAQRRLELEGTDTRNLPEIRVYEDGFLIYKDEMPMAGAQKFPLVALCVDFLKKQGYVSWKEPPEESGDDTTGEDAHGD